MRRVDGRLRLRKGAVPHSRVPVLCGGARVRPRPVPPLHAHRAARVGRGWWRVRSAAGTGRRLLRKHEAAAAAAQAPAAWPIQRVRLGRLCEGAERSASMLRACADASAQESVKKNELLGEYTGELISQVRLRVRILHPPGADGASAGAHVVRGGPARQDLRPRQLVVPVQPERPVGAGCSPAGARKRPSHGSRRR